MPLRRFKRLLTALSGILLAAGLAVPNAHGEAYNLTTLGFFGGPNGGSPRAGVLQGQDGCLYGTTFMGGASGMGGIFKIPPGGSLSNFVSLTAGIGSRPYAGLIQTSDGF